jgi:hypothetical protein
VLARIRDVHTTHLGRVGGKGGLSKVGCPKSSTRLSVKEEPEQRTEGRMEGVGVGWAACGGWAPDLGKDGGGGNGVGSVWAVGG